MKILKPRISILMLSICFFIGSTEILNALHFDVKTADPARTKGKDAPVEGGTPTTSGGRPPVPKEAYKSTSGPKHETTATPDTAPAEGKNSPKSIDVRAFDDSMPTTKSINNTSGPLKTTARQDKAATESSGIPLGRDVAEAAPKASVNKNAKAEKSTKNLFETDEADPAEQRDEVVHVDKNTKPEDRTKRSAQEKASDKKPETQLTEEQEKQIDEKKSAFSKTLDAFSKFFESAMRFVKQDHTLSREQIDSFQTLVTKGKEDINKAKADLEIASKAIVKLDKEMKAMKITNEDIEALRQIDSGDFSYDKKNTNKALKDLANKKEIKEDDLSAVFKDYTSMKDLKSRINQSIGRIESDITQIISKTNTNSTIYNDLIKSLDNLDSASKNAIMERVNSSKTSYTTKLKDYFDFQNPLSVLELFAGPEGGL